jgi:hypothetical protein
MNANPALNHIIKAQAFAGCRINFYDYMVVVANDSIATNVDRKHIREYTDAFFDPLSAVFVTLHCKLVSPA